MDLIWEDQDSWIYFSELKSDFLSYHPPPVTEPSFWFSHSRFQRVPAGDDIPLEGGIQIVSRSRFTELVNLRPFLVNAGFSDPDILAHLCQAITSRAEFIARGRDAEPLINVVLRIYTSTSEEHEQEDDDDEMESDPEMTEELVDFDEYESEEYYDDDDLMMMEESHVVVSGLQSKALDEDESEECCVICSEKLGSVVKVMPCLHYYHQHCIFHWLTTTNTCPLCRFQLPSHNH